MKPATSVLAASVLAVGLGQPTAEAADTQREFPAKAIKIIAPASPGGGWDQLARLLQYALSDQQLVSVPIEVVNRGGAGGTIGLAELVTRHQGDPYVLMIGGGVLVGSELTHGSPFSLRDTTSLVRLLSEYQVVAVPATSPYRTLPELLTAFVADPDGVTWGGGSAGGVDHVLVGLIADKMGVDASMIRYVAFPGGGDAAAAVMGGKVSAGVSGYGEWEGLAAGGRMRLLAVSSASRVGDRSIPTLVEQGLDVTLENWRGVFGAPGIDPANRDWYVEALSGLRRTEAWQEILRRNKWEDTFLAGEGFERFLAREYQDTQQILTRLGLGTGGEGYAVVGPYFFPTIVFAGLLASLAVIILLGLRRRISARPVAEARPGFLQKYQPEEVIGEASKPASWRRFLFSAMLMLAYVLSFKPFGFLVSTPIFVVAQARIVGSRNILRDAAVALLLTGFVYVVFRHVLAVELP